MTRGDTEGVFGAGRNVPGPRGGTSHEENSERKPLFYNVDLNAYKNFKVGGAELTLFVRVFNLFDRLNEKDVYSDTGRANYSITAAKTGTIFGVNTLDEYLIRPDFYSSPRQIITGISFYF